MARLRLNHETVVDGAVSLVNSEGSDALSLAELAGRFRVRTPSLYNHVDGLDGLRVALTLRALQGLNREMRLAATGVAGKDALLAMAAGYRAFASANPGLYPFLLRSTEGEGEAIQAASDELMQLMFAVLRGYALPREEMVHAARFVRSALHGFVSLEAAAGFGLPEDVDKSFGRLTEAVDGALAHWPRIAPSKA